MPLADINDPGPDGLFIFAPRNADGAPVYSDTGSADDVMYPMTGNAPMVRAQYVKRMPDGSTHPIRIDAPDVPTVSLDILRPLLADWAAAERAKH